MYLSSSTDDESSLPHTGSDESEILIALSLAHLPNHNEVNMLDNYFNSSRLNETWSVYGVSDFFSI